MKYKIRFQCKSDLRIWRECFKLSKEYVANEIGYSVRNLERIEKENAIVTEETAKKLCDLYKIEYQDYFYKTDKNFDDNFNRILAESGTVPKNIIDSTDRYYLIYVRRTGFYQDCIAGKVMWVGDYNRNKERRILREVNVINAVKLKPEAQLINNKNEWTYWYFNLTIGKLYEAIVSEPCMKDCLEDCLREIIVTQDDLMKYDVFTDIAVLGGKNKYRKKSY